MPEDRAGTPVRAAPTWTAPDRTAAAPPVRETRLPLDDGSLVDLLDRLLDTGVVLDGNVLLTLAGVDLVRLDLRLLLASVESLRDPHDAPGEPHHRQDGIRGPDGAPRRGNGPYPSYNPYGEVYGAPMHGGAEGRRSGGRARQGSLTGPADRPPVRRQPDRPSIPDLPMIPRSPSVPRLPPEPVRRATERDWERFAGPPRHSERDPAAGVAGLVVAVVDIVRQLLERQALRRMDAGSLSDTQVERLGRALIGLEEQVRHLSELLGARRQSDPPPP